MAIVHYGTSRGRSLIAFSYLPMAGIVLVFKQYNFKQGIFGSPWVEPIYKNFKFFFNNLSTAMRSTRLTVMYNILFFIVGTIMAVAIAVMLGEITNKLFIKVSQSLMFLPYFISWMGNRCNLVRIIECRDRHGKPDCTEFWRRRL